MENKVNEDSNSIYIHAGSLRLWGRILLFVIIGISLVSLAGDLFNLSFFTDDSGWSAMRPITAYSFILSSVAAALINTTRVKNRRIYAITSGVLLIVVGLITILDYSAATGQIFQPGSRMAFITSLLFVITGIIFLLLNSGKNAGFAHGLILIVFCVSYFVPLNYILGATPLYSIQYINVSLLAGVNFCLFSVAILCFYPGTWFMRVFTENSSGGYMARRLLIGIIVIPIIIGWLRMTGERMGLYKSETGVVLITVTYTFCLLIFIWFLSNNLIKADKKQRNYYEELRNQSYFINTVAETVPVMISIIELPSRKPVYVNRKPFSENGFTSDGILNMTAEQRLNIVHPDDEYILDSFFNKLSGIQTDDSVSIEYRARNNKGEWMWFNAVGKAFERTNGKVKSCINVIQNITIEKESKIKLSASENLNRMLADNISQLAWISNKEGSVTWLNRRWLDFTGLSNEELLGDGRFKIIHPDYLKEVSESISEAITKGDVWNKTYPMKSRTGEYHWFLSVAIPIKDEEGNVFQWFGTSTDITDQKKAELEIKTKNEELTSFIYSVSHDLKSPLFTIQSFLPHLVEHIEENDKPAQQTDLRFIQGAIDIMSRRITELVELSKIGLKEKPKTSVKFGEIAQQAIELVAGSLKQKNVKIICENYRTVIYGYSERLLQLMQNLLDNSVKFMGSQQNPLIEIGSGSDAQNGIVFFVRDNGSGINPKYHHKVFGLFEKLDASADGTGIGLTLVKKIVELHGGSIWISSDGEGKGTTFYFTLPGSYYQEGSPGKNKVEFRLS